MTESALRDGKVLTMAGLQDSFEELLRDNDCSNQKVTRKVIKSLLKSEIPDVEFHKAQRLNESDRVTVKKTRDNAVNMCEDKNVDCDADMKALFDAAAILRKSINDSKRWEFSGSLEDESDDIVPERLFRFFKWLIQGTKAEIEHPDKALDVKKRALSLSQSAMSMCLSDRQTSNKKSESLRFSREMLQQLAVGLAVHQSTRSKSLINMLHGFGMAVEYNRILRVEAQIEATVVQRMEENGGVYIPSDVVFGRYMFMAIDNSDFNEDTYDGQNTLHGASIAIYQKIQPGDPEPNLR